MSDEMQTIIRRIEAERDDFVRRCNAAIEALRGREDATAEIGQHRFEAGVTSRPGRRVAKAGRNPRSRATGIAHARKRKESGGSAESGEAKSVKDIIREAVLSQTQPFTLSNIKDYVRDRYPMVIGKIKGNRYSKELYNLRKTERQFDISSRGEKGGAHVFKLKAA
jgi:hypothetical protein